MDNGAETAVPQGGAPSPGAILAAERERQGLSRADIAQRLHMSVMQIEALELGDYERLPRGPFLRGFARNYARVLGIDAEAIVGMLTATAPRESAPRIVVPTQNIRFDPLGARLASPYVKAAGYAAVAIVLGFAAMYWWLFVRPLGPVAAPARKPVAATPAPTAPAPEAPAAGAAPDAPPGPLAPPRRYRPRRPRRAFPWCRIPNPRPFARRRRARPHRRCRPLRPRRLPGRWHPLPPWRSRCRRRPFRARPGRPPMPRAAVSSA
ncbi:MAG: helix-turn-helix domain-containing protein [Betaproteobacteria bacterium]|nr:helix-turn-helix domain-containing protein [Betaproteobacteria bacterium]